MKFQQELLHNPKSVFHPTHSLHCIQTPHLRCPTQAAICLFTHWRPKAPPPFNGSGKKKGSFAHGLVLAAGSFQSFNRSLHRSYLSTPITNSFCSPHQLQHPACKCFVPHSHTFPHPQQQHSRLFFVCKLFAP